MGPLPLPSASPSIGGGLCPTLHVFRATGRIVSPAAQHLPRRRYYISGQPLLQRQVLETPVGCVARSVNSDLRPREQASSASPGRMRALALEAQLEPQSRQTLRTGPAWSPRVRSGRVVGLGCSPPHPPSVVTGASPAGHSGEDPMETGHPGWWAVGLGYREEPLSPQGPALEEDLPVVRPQVGAGRGAAASSS